MIGRARNTLWTKLSKKDAPVKLNFYSDIASDFHPRLNSSPLETVYNCLNRHFQARHFVVLFNFVIVPVALTDSCETTFW